MKTTSQFSINGTTQIVKLTDKANGIEAFSITGNRWFQKSYGNTYHVAYIDALINGKWVELGCTKMQYGYGDHFLVSAGAWLIENGYVECENEYFLSNYNVREDFAVDCTVSDVDRKRDL
jgi:hypothetical protein